MNRVTGKAVTEFSQTLLTLEVTNAQDFVPLIENQYGLITKVSSFPFNLKRLTKFKLN